MFVDFCQYSVVSGPLKEKRPEMIPQRTTDNRQRTLPPNALVEVSGVML